MYLMACARPDLAFEICRLPRSMKQPTTELRTCDKRVLWFIKGTARHGTNFKAFSGKQKTIDCTLQLRLVWMPAASKITFSIWVWGSTGSCIVKNWKTVHCNCWNRKQWLGVSDAKTFFSRERTEICSRFPEQSSRHAKSGHSRSTQDCQEWHKWTWL